MTDLLEALRSLRAERGDPPLRVIAEKGGCSHTSVGDVMNGRRRSITWKLTRAIVTGLGADPADYHGLWRDHFLTASKRRSGHKVGATVDVAVLAAFASDPRITGVTGDDLFNITMDLKVRCYVCRGALWDDDGEVCLSAVRWPWHNGTTAVVPAWSHASCSVSTMINLIHST